MLRAIPRLPTTPRSLATLAHTTKSCHRA
ncbi:hypothetical protein CGCVW01_v014533 [Colletotrichum viniferum]|nr:hypothetical protein CGCVW01_v014533 [Colletotrichum viniferum]